MAMALGVSVTTSFADDARPDRNWASPGETRQAVTAPSQEVPDWLPKDADVQPFSRIDQLQTSTASIAPVDPSLGFRMPQPAAPQPAPTPAAVTTPGAPFQMGQPAAEAAQPAASAPTASVQQEQKPTIDLTALRYYASKNDIARVAAEIRRIRSAHPDWTPPETLFSEQKAAVDEQPMWNLYSQGKLEPIYKMIEAQKEKDPDYVPSADLVQKLKVAEARRAIQASVDAKNYGRVLTIAQQMPELLVCEEMQVLWNVGESYVKTKVPQRAFELYSYILNNCNDSTERFATVQKASQLLPEAALPYLVRLGRPKFDGSGEFDSVLLDTVRRKVGEAMSSRVGPRPTSEEIEQLTNVAATEGKPDDSILLAWYYYNKKDFQSAKQWFDRVLQTKFDMKALEGYILTLRENKEIDEARDIALEYSSSGFPIAKLYIEIVASELTDDDPAAVPDATLNVLKSVIEEHKSALGAQSLAWYLYNHEDHKEARDWFEKSVEWEPTEEGILGLAIAQNKLGNRKAVKELAANYGDNFPTLDAFVDRIGPEPSTTRAASRGGGSRKSATRRSSTRQAQRSRASGGDPLMKEALAAYESGNYDKAIETLDARRAKKGETRDVTVLRGWALHNKGRHKDAYKLFTKLEKDRSTKQVRDGARYSWQSMMPPRFH